MTKNRSVSIEDSNDQWIEENAQICGMRYATYLNQLIRMIRGDTSAFTHITEPDSIKSKVDGIHEEVATKISSKKKKFFEDAYIRYAKDRDNFNYSAWANDIADFKYGLEGIMPSDLEDYFKVKRKKMKRQELLEDCYARLPDTYKPYQEIPAIIVYYDISEKKAINTLKAMEVFGWVREISVGKFKKVHKVEKKDFNPNDMPEFNPEEVEQKG